MRKGPPVGVQWTEKIHASIHPQQAHADRVIPKVNTKGEKYEGTFDLMRGDMRHREMFRKRSASAGVEKAEPLVAGERTNGLKREGSLW